MTLPIRIDMTGVEGQKDYEPIPPGTQPVMITDYSQTEASDESKNPGAPLINWEFTIQGGDFDTRRVWDNMVIAESTKWRVKALLDAVGEPSEGEIDLAPDKLVGRELSVKLAVQPEKTDSGSGRTYKARNRVAGFYPLQSS